MNPFIARPTILSISRCPSIATFPSQVERCWIMKLS